MSGLTPALSRYLLAIKRGCCRRTDLTCCLSVAKPSVTKAVSRLASLGYVEESTGRILSLTEEGSMVAEALRESSGIIERCLVGEGVPESCARRLAEEGMLGGCLLS